MKYFLLSVLLVLHAASVAQHGFSLAENKSARKIEILYDGKMVTAYCYFDSTEKPILYPVKTLSGITVTRGYPVAPRRGERTDHPHHAGLWFTYESVNGLDFWNNSSAIPQERKHSYGSIVHQKTLSKTAKGDVAELLTLSHWVDPKGKVLLEEKTHFTFRRENNDLIIDRKCELKAIADEVVFKDVKDGLLGIRVARDLEMPSTQADKFIDSSGNETSVPMLNNEGVSGMYVNREGTEGDKVWSSQSNWVQLYGTVRNEPVALVILDHPENPGYPAYWHARGYGLFAVNPLGRNVFSEGKEHLNLTLTKGKTATFQYRVVIHEGEKLSGSEVDKMMDDFHRAK